ncbi:MAG: Gldg family protein [Planctomycetota bacterium]
MNESESAVPAHSGKASVRMSRGRRWAGRLELLIAATLALCSWFAITALATRPALRAIVDVTPQARFSVGDETQALFAELARKQVSIEIDTFFQRPPQPTNEFEQRIVAIQSRVQELTRDFLNVYVARSAGQVTVKHYDLLRDVAASRERIEQLGGLRREDVIVVSVGKRHRELQLLADLAEIDIPASRQVAVPGAKRALPSLKLYKGEEAVGSAVRSLLVEGTPRLYFLTGYQEADLERPVADSYSELVAELVKDGFEVARWNLESEGRMPDDAAVVGLIEPRAALSPRAVDRIVEWLQRGGRMFINLAWSNVDAEGRRGALDELGSRIGFVASNDVVCHPVPDPARPEAPGADGPPARILTLAPSAGHPATRALVERQRYPQMTHARELRARDAGPGFRFEPLLTTGRFGWLAPFDPRFGDADLRMPQAREELASRAVGAVIDVTPSEGTREGAVVLLGGVAFLNQIFTQNGDLALNLFDWLAQREELVAIRGQRFVSTKVELTPQQLDRSRGLLLRWTPGAILLMSVVVFLVRRRR